jgi:hypothetical protein
MLSFPGNQPHPLAVGEARPLADKPRLSGGSCLRVLRETYGAAEERRWWVRWRVFFLACAELFAWRGSEE